MATLAVTFDAAGTLITPARPVAETYARFARAHDIPADPAALARRFRAAFSAAPPLAFPGAPPARVSELEHRWWTAIVRRALAPPDDTPIDACVSALMAHYARPDAWHVFPDVAPALDQLAGRGCSLAVVSNFDRRLAPLLIALGLAERFAAIVASSEVGAAKPDPAIFGLALARLGVSARDAVHVGDSEQHDVRGALAAGLDAVLLVRGSAHTADDGAVPVVRDLTELPRLVARR